MKRRKQNRRVKQAGEVQTHCPHCLTLDSEQSALSLVDTLYHSQTELCATLRLVGRQLLQFEKPGDGLLDKVREVLKRAENIQQTVRSESVLSDAIIVPALYGSRLEAETPMPVSEYGPNVPGGDIMPEPGHHRSRLRRPHALRIIKFPG